MRIGYLYSRYPLVSQTFCDEEMLGLEGVGVELVVGSLYPPPDTLRHDRVSRLRAPVEHAPPTCVAEALERRARRDGEWPGGLVEAHRERYGEGFKPAVRARNALYFADAFRRHGVQHVHVPFANRALHTALFLCEMTGWPMSFTTHGQDFMVDLGSDDLLREMCARAAFVVAVCDYSRDLLRGLAPESAGRIIRVYNGLDADAFTMRPPHVQGDVFRVLAVGRLIEFKGFHHLLDAVGLLAGRGVDVRLRVIGSGPWEGRLRERAGSLGIDGRVSWAGSMGNDEVREELRKADAFAMGSVVDGKGASDLLPTVLTEAMLTGLPVVGTRVAGIPEMIEDGGNGFLVEPGSAEALAVALGRLAEDSSLRQRMGECGRAMAESRFSSRVTLPELVRRYEGHLACGHHKPSAANSVRRARHEVNDNCGLVDSEPPAPPDVLAFYDFRLPGREEWLEGESVGMEGWGKERRGGLRVLAACEATRKRSPVPELALSVAEWLPDGMVLEMEWRSRRAWRMQLESQRMDGFTTVDGAVYLRAARRAVWLALRVRALEPGLVFAAGIEESLAVWLARCLVPFRYACAFESARRWNGGVLRRLAGSAAAVCDGSGKQLGFDDSLMRGDRRRGVAFGPLKLRVKPRAANTWERSQAMRVFLEGAGE